MAVETEPKQTSQIQEGPGEEEKEPERLTTLKEQRIARTLNEVRDFLEECYDRIEGGEDYGHFAIWAKRGKIPIHIRTERSISLNGTPKAKWSK